MKKIISIVGLIALIGCTDLDIEPKNGLVETVAFQNFEGYQAYIAKVYASLTLTGQQGAAGQGDLSIINDEGFSSYLRVWWKAQELTTDETVMAWTDSGIRDLHNHEWGADNQFVRVLYYRIYYTISLANDFLRVSNELPAGLSDEETATIKQYRAEARFIRAFSYWHALDHFRNVALITSITSDLPTQKDPKVIFDFIENELNEIDDQLLAPGQSNHGYGRIDKATAWMLKAKLFLNSEVYTGVNRYADCIIEVQKVTESGVYSLASNYQELFMGDNHFRSDEIIWPIVHDGLVSQTWGGTTTIIRGGIGGAMADGEVQGIAAPDEGVDNYGVTSGWAGYRTTSSLIDKYNAVAFSDNLNTNAAKWTLPSNNSWTYSSAGGRLSYTPNAETYLEDGVSISPSFDLNRNVKITFSFIFKDAEGVEVTSEMGKILTGYVSTGNASGETNRFNMTSSGTFSFEVNIGSDTEIRFYGTDGPAYETMELDIVNITYTDGDGRFLFYTEGQSLEIEDIGEFTDGYAAPKFSNLEASTGQRAPGVDQVSTDYPVFRLAEAYLILAEAQLRSGGSIDATTLQYLNDLRERAYGNNSGNITAGDVDLDWILDERARELYLEATRRTDLVRFDKFSGGDYLWPWKGGVDKGTATPGYLDIFPIPASDLIANPNLEQNDGY